MSLFMEDILEQPKSLEKLFSEKEKIERKVKNMNPGRILLSGMGSSYFAASYATIYLRQNGILAETKELSEVVNYSCEKLLEKYDLIILVSQSGKTIELIRFIEKYSAFKDKCILITNDLLSEGASYFTKERIFDLAAGKEKAMGSSKTFVNSIVLLVMISEIITKQKIDFTDLIGSIAEALEIDIDDYAEKFLKNDHQILIARGYGVPITGMAKLTVAEVAKIPISIYSGAAFRHGPLELLNSNPGLTILNFMGATKDKVDELIEDLPESIKPFIIGNSENSNIVVGMDLPEVLSAIPSIIIFQKLSEKLADIKHFKAGVGTFASKITTKE